MVAKRHLEVICGIIQDGAGRLLVALRDFEAEQGGLWEFPGGKLEFGEALERGLSRELYEELNIEVLEAAPWMQINHEYSLYHITLHVWKVIRYSGEPMGNEGQFVQWVDQNALNKLEFPSANRSVVAALIQEAMPVNF